MKEKKIKFLLASIICFVWIPSTIVMTYPHPGGMHSQILIDTAKWRISNDVEPFKTAYQKLITYADAALNHVTHALTDFAVPGYYIDKDLHIKNAGNLQVDAFDAYACALAYHLSSGQTKYADGALRFLMAWANVNKNYSQLDGSLVMSYAGGGLVVAGELLYNYNGWSKTDKATYMQWVRTVFKVASDARRTEENNAGDWGRFGSVIASYLLDNSTEINENLQLIKKFVSQKIAPEGHLPSETKREGNGIWYTYFALAPLTASMFVISQATGQNLFVNSTELSIPIKKALDSLYFYNTNPTKWTWYTDARTGSPKDVWPFNLFEAMNYIYDDYRFNEYPKLARPIFYTGHHTAWTFPTLMRPQFK